MQYVFPHGLFYYTASNLQNLLCNYCNVEIVCLESTASTNDSLKQQIKCGQITHEKLIITLEQTRGRGQFNRIWHSEKHECLMLSFCMPINKVNSAFSLVCGLSVQQALKQIFNLNTHIKWANDIIWQNKKLAGLLVEVVSRGGNNYIIIGLGLNWLTPIKINNLNIPAIGLDNYLYKISIQSVVNFINYLINIWSYNISLCIKEGFSPFLPLWNKVVYLPNIPQLFSLNSHSKIQGIYHHVDELGQLFIIDENKQIVKI